MRVHWTNNAIRNLSLIYNYIAQNSPTYAQRTVDRLTRRSQQIASFPKSGRMVPEYQDPDIREVLEGSYRIIYRLKPNQIDVLTVVHSAQMLPSSL